MYVHVKHVVYTPRLQSNLARSNADEASCMGKLLLRVLTHSHTAALSSHPCTLQLNLDPTTTARRQRAPHTDGPRGGPPAQCSWAGSC